MGYPEQVWNEADLPFAEQTKITRESDESSIQWERTEESGTSARGLLSFVDAPDGTCRLAKAGEKPLGVIVGSDRKGSFLNLERGYNICVPRGDKPAASSVNVVNAGTLSSTSALTIADDLNNYLDAVILTLTPASAALVSSGTPGTVVITGRDGDGDTQTETVSFATGALTAAQDTETKFRKVTSVTTTGFNAGTVTITASVVADPRVNQTVIGATKTVSGVAKDGYAGSHASNGIGRITKVTSTHIFFNLP